MAFKKKVFLLYASVVLPELLSISTSSLPFNCHPEDLEMKPTIRESIVFT